MTGDEFEPVRAAIVGLGWWGKVLVSAMESPTSRLRFVLGVTKDLDVATERFAVEHDFGLSDDIEEALNDHQVEAVVLATPHSQHVDQIVRCANAGRAVFSEKPLALTLDEARLAVDTCARRQVVLGLGNDKRFLPAVRELKRMVTEGELGDVLHIEAQYSNDNSRRNVFGAWRAIPEEAPGAGMSGPGLHALDAIVHLGGQAARASAVQHLHTPAPGSTDSVAAVLEMANGATAALSSVRGTPDAFRLQVAGTSGWAEVRDFGTLVRSTNGEIATTSYPTDLETSYLLTEFATAVRDIRPFPISTNGMLATVAAFEAIIQSLDTRAPVNIEAISEPI